MRLGCFDTILFLFFFKSSWRFFFTIRVGQWLIYKLFIISIWPIIIIVRMWMWTLLPVWLWLLTTLHSLAWREKKSFILELCSETRSGFVDLKFLFLLDTCALSFENEQVRDGKRKSNTERFNHFEFWVLSQFVAFLRVYFMMWTFTTLIPNRTKLKKKKKQRKRDTWENAIKHQFFNSFGRICIRNMNEKSHHILIFYLISIHFKKKTSISFRNHFRQIWRWVWFLCTLQELFPIKKIFSHMKISNLSIDTFWWMPFILLAIPRSFLPIRTRYSIPHPWIQCMTMWNFSKIELKTQCCVRWTWNT